MRTRRSQSSSDPMPSSDRHRSVLLHEAVEYLAIKSSDTVVDATIGGAGHFAALLERIGEGGMLIGFDLDPDAIERARNAHGSDSRIHLIRGNFRTMERALQEIGIDRIDKALFDLGWSSHQLGVGRGFSFLADEPLSMAFDPSQSLTAKTIVNLWEESSISDVLFGWGEERYAHRIARAIVEARENNQIETAKELAEIVKAAVPRSYRFGRIHPATKTFQAFRIAVNDELGSLEEGLRAAWKLLNLGGRIAVISFHSIEDRIVKRLFATFVKEGGELVVRKPITPSEQEIAENPRSRSAKMRVIEKKNHA